MLSPRGVTVSVAGVAMWFTARLIGSPGLEVVGIGLGVLPFLAASSMLLARPRVAVDRRLSDTNVAPGSRVTVTLEIRNLTTARTPVFLVEDRLPAPLGRPARMVVTGVRPRGRHEVSYTLLPQTRGRYIVGPVAIDVGDAFGLTRRRIVLDERGELLVTPEVEDLSAPPDPSNGVSVGGARARKLLRAGEDYFTMRSFQEGDDLRRIHWPSVARTGDMMIRQDEASARASSLIFVDNREAALGRSHTPAFERAVSCAASVGVLLARHGFALRFATADAAGVPLSEGRLLDALTGLSHNAAPTLSPSLTRLRAAASADASLVFVAAPPAAQELPSPVRAGAAFGPKVAILVHPADPAAVPPSRRTELDARATQAFISLTRAGWDCLVLSPSTRLAERWHAPRERTLASNA
jgi:uncharacterized protein (DUF58 family)